MEAETSKITKLKQKIINNLEKILGILCLLFFILISMSLLCKDLSLSGEFEVSLFCKDYSCYKSLWEKLLGVSVLAKSFLYIPGDIFSAFLKTLLK